MSKDRNAKANQGSGLFQKKNGRKGGLVWMDGRGWSGEKGGGLRMEVAGKKRGRQIVCVGGRAGQVGFQGALK